MNRKSFTLIELLIVLSILALIIGLLISIIKPAEIYKKARDNQRIVDLSYLDSNIKSYLLLANPNAIYTTSTLNKIFLSLKLPSSATNTDCRNYFPDLPSLPSGWTYVCSKNPTSTDGAGWLPINFQNYMLYSISNLPLDPFNNSTYYYAFVASGTDFILYTMLEDPKNQASKNDQDNYPHLYSAGTNKRLIDQAQGLVGYFPFDEGTGTIAYDYSGNGNNGTLLDASSTNSDGNRPPQWTTGKVGGALSFDGVDDYVNIPSSNLTTSSLRYILRGGASSSSFTIVFWKNSQAPVTNNYWIGRVGWTNGIDLDCRFILFDASNNAYSTTFSCTHNNWEFIVASWDKSAMKFYFNGNKVGERSFSGILRDNNYPIQIGGQTGVTWYFARGLIDEVRIYNRALSDAEIKALYDATK